MLYREVIAVCSEIHTKHIYTLCGQNVELVNVKSGGIYSYHLATEGRRPWHEIHSLTPNQGVDPGY